MILENNSLNDYHIDQCLNLIDFLRDRRSSSPKFYLNFLDDNLKLKIKEQRKKTQYSIDGTHVWVTAKLDKIYFETYYIHPHNNDENTVEDGFIEINDVMLKSIRQCLMKMTEHKLKEDYQREIKIAEQNLINEKNNRINFEISDMVCGIAAGRTPTKITDLVNLDKNEKPKTKIAENNILQLCEDLRNDWAKKAGFLETVGANDQASVLRTCIGDLYNKVQSKLKGE